MRILDRYIVHSIIRIFLMVIVIFGFLYVLIDLTSNLDEVIGQSVSFPILMKYYLNMLPGVMTQITPFACLLACIFTYSQLNSQNEVIAMRASGLNFWQITKPALYFTLVIAALMFMVNEKFVPSASLESKQLHDQYMIIRDKKSKEKHEVIKNLTFYGLKNRLYFIDSFDADHNLIEGITVIEHDENQNITQKISALHGAWTGIAWKFEQCQITIFDNSFTNPSVVKVYKEKLMDIKETPDDFLKQRVDVQLMNIKQLQSYINRFANSGATRALDNLKVDLYQKFAYPLMNLVVVLIGLPFSLLVRGRKNSTFTCFGIALLIGFLYYVTNAISLALGKNDTFPPLVAAFGTPLVFALSAFYLIEEKF